MKMHSYMNINGYLSHVNQQAQAVMDQLRQATLKLGSWEDAIAAAKSSRHERERAAHSSEDEAPTNDGPIADSPTQAANGQADATLRKRNNATKDALVASVNPDQVVTTGNRVLSPDEVLKPAPHPLVDHPDEAIASLAREFSELDSELISSGPEYVRWPHTITLKNFATYMIIPTLVYELEYPRTER